MEIQFQQQQKAKIPVSKTCKMKAARNNKYVGVRQRPSGRWVAEIKDTTQKIRMWLGTFETAEEAARAYDEAACLLRGSNTRTNFVVPKHHVVSPNSPLASRIRNLLNTNNKATDAKNVAKPHEKESESSSQDSEIICPATSTSSSTTSSTSSPAADTAESFDDKLQSEDCSQLFDDVYKPELSSTCDMASSAPLEEWGFDHRLSLAQELMLDFLPYNNKDHEVMSLNGAAAEELSEFERMKVERQISASLYAINGLHDYMQYDPAEETFWDLPPLLR